MLIDSHAHLNFKAFEKDFDEVIKRSLAENIRMINVGSEYDTSKKAIEIAEKYNGVHAAVGLHPIHAEMAENFYTSQCRSLCLSSKKVVAIGEIGLDYFRDYGKFKDRQKEVLLEQLNLAKELNLPVILHCRMAHEDLLQILEEQRTKNNEQPRGVIHCFTGNWQEAKKYLDMGFCLGMNGIMFKFDLKEVIKKTPLDKILVETDCPYLTPPQSKTKRNEPVNVEYIVQEIAKIKKISFEEIAQATVQNTKNLFNI